MTTNEAAAKDYILLADFEDEEMSRVCGRTSSEAVAHAWWLGEGHHVYVIPVDGPLKGEGYEAIDFE